MDRFQNRYRIGSARAQWWDYGWNGAYFITIPPQPGHPSGQKSIGQTRFQNQGKNTVSSIVGGYKSAVTKHTNRLGLKHAWQSRFHDHIIRNDAEYQRISEYIINNPTNWKDDKFFAS